MNKSEVRRICALAGMTLLTVAAVIFPVLLPALARADKTPEIYLSTTKGAGKISVIIPDFTREGGFTDPQKRDKAMADELADDLNFSGFFDAKRVKEVKGDPSAWASLDVNDIVSGGYSTDGHDITISAKLVDAKAGSVIMSKDYPNSLLVMRQNIHRLADDIIFQLTGEKGICQTKIAFISDMTRHDELYIADYDGHNVIRLTSDSGICLLPAWSPSGNYITYTSYKRLNPDLWWVSTSGKSRGVISFAPGLNTAASWSPDGQRIALCLSKGANAQIYTMDRDGKGLTQITHTKGINTSPSWSPNGREIVFNTDRAGSPQVYVMDSDGGNVRRLTYSGKYNASPAWSPNGDKIAYVSREGGVFNIFMMDSTGDNVVRLTWNGGSNENPSWSPDGRHIVFSSTRTGKNAIYLMDTHGENVKKLPLNGSCQTPAWSPRMGSEK
jgi:TolB protein